MKAQTNDDMILNELQAMHRYIAVLTAEVVGIREALEKLPAAFADAAALRVPPQRLDTSGIPYHRDGQQQ